MVRASNIMPSSDHVLRVHWTNWLACLGREGLSDNEDGWGTGSWCVEGESGRGIE